MTLLQNGQPLWRSKTPSLVVQEMYGLLLGHYLVRASQACGVTATRLSFKRSLEIAEDHLPRPAVAGWWAPLARAVGWQELGPKRPRRYPRVKKASRSRWPNKKPGTKPPPPSTVPLHKVLKSLQTDEH